jgi:hypothetical protein
MAEDGTTATHGGLTGTVHLPVFGAVKKKTAVYAGVGAVGFVIVVYWTRQHNAAKAGTTPDTGPAPIDPSIDPATGIPWADEGGPGFGDAGSGSMPFPGGSNTDTGAIDTSTPGGPPFNDNSAWAQFVEQAMGSTGSDAIAAAIGHYLNGSELTDAEKTTAEEAVAIGNKPPIPGPGGFPPSFRSKAVPGHPVNAHNPVSDLHVTARFTQADVSWKAEPNAAHYLVKITGGGKTIAEATVTGTKHTFHGLKRGHHYTAQVRAQPGGAGGTNARVNFTTK